MSLSTMKIDRLYSAFWTKQRWLNLSNYCNGKRHPTYFPYRRYRRGKNRCKLCGAKLGKIKCVRKSSRDLLIDDIFRPNPLMEMLKKERSYKMNEEHTFVVLVTIDTSETIGATCIYGEHVMEEILKAGAKVKGYKISCSQPDRVIKLDKATEIAVIANIDKE